MPRFRLSPLLPLFRVSSSAREMASESGTGGAGGGADFDWTQKLLVPGPTMTGQHDLTLIQQLMEITDERDRMSMCSVNKKVRTHCNGSAVYGRLCARDFPDLKSNRIKLAVVGGTDRDGTWARYYRLLLRSDQCCAAVREYLRLTTEEERVAAMQGYDPHGFSYSGNGVPMERFFFERAHALFIAERPGVPDWRMPFDTYSRSMVDKMTEDKEKFIGEAVLGWARFVLAMQNRPIYTTIVLSPEAAAPTDPQMRIPISDAYWRAPLTVIFNYVDSEVVREALRIYFQADGPVQRLAKRARMGIYDDLFRALLDRADIALCEFAVAELGLYTVEYSVQMSTMAQHSRRLDFVLLLMRSDRLLDRYQLARDPLFTEFHMNRWHQMYAGPPHVALHSLYGFTRPAYDRLPHLIRIRDWERIDAIIAEETARLAGANAAAAGAN